MQNIIKTFFFATLFIVSMASSAIENDFKQQMEKLSQTYFSTRPEMATYYGLSNKKAGMGVDAISAYYDPAAENNRRQIIKTMLKQLDAIDATTLTSKQSVSLELIKFELNAAFGPAQQVEYGSVLGEYGFWFLPYPVSHLSGAHVEFPTMMEDKFAVTNESQANAYLSRLSSYPKIIDGLIKKIDHDKNLGVIPPDFVIDNTISNLKHKIKLNAEKHPLVTSFEEKLKANSVESQPHLITTAIAHIKSGYIPATQRLIDRLTVLKDSAKHHAGIDRLPNGKALYQAMITHMSDTTMTPEDIHKLGLSEVDRISNEMDGLLQKVGYKQGSVGERMGKLLKDPKYVYPNTEQGKKKILSDINADLALINKELDKWFGLLPTQKVVVKAVPEHLATSGSGAYYDGPALDGSRPGTFWIIMNDTESLPSYSLQTLTYHETNPGHHLQTVISLSDELPILNAIFYSNAAGEGWALYAERLAFEMGIYQNDPVDDIGRLQAELHRAVRLVVDTGMHAFGWSREKAIDYSIKTEGIHMDEAVGEIERYAVWPGQALGYKLGELKIRYLREKAKKALGEKFDIRTFHDRILEDGTLPLNLMEKKINRWIKSSQG